MLPTPLPTHSSCASKVQVPISFRRLVPSRRSGADEFSAAGPSTEMDLTMPRPERGAITLAIDVAGVRVDAATVDALARLQLAVRRDGCQVRLWRATPELRELLAFMGLRDVLPESP